MSLFIAGQAFPVEFDFAASEIAVFIASILSAAIGTALLWSARTPPLSPWHFLNSGPVKAAEIDPMSTGLPMALAATPRCQPSNVPALSYSAYPRSPDWNMTPDAESRGDDQARGKNL
jgi:hypothetical protein